MKNIKFILEQFREEGLDGAWLHRYSLALRELEDMKELVKQVGNLTPQLMKDAGIDSAIWDRLYEIP